MLAFVQEVEQSIPHSLTRPSTPWFTHGQNVQRASRRLALFSLAHECAISGGIASDPRHANIVGITGHISRLQLPLRTPSSKVRKRHRGYVHSA